MPIDDELPSNDAAVPGSDAASAVTTAAQTASAASSTASSIAEGDTAGAVASATSGATDVATAAAPEMPSEAAAAMRTASAATSIASAPTPTAAASGAIDAVGATGLAPAGTPQVAQSVLAAAGNIPAAPSAPAAASTPTSTSSPTIGSTSQAVLSMFTGTPEPVTLAFDAPSVTSSVWTASSLHLTESLSAPYVLDLHLSTDDLDADETELLGASVTVHLRRGVLERDVSGIVEEVTTDDAPSDEAHTKGCHVRVVPALTLLGYRRDTRMFWDKDVVEILKDVLEKPLSEFDRTVEFHVERTLPKCEYRTQYDESDLAFAQRLIGEEGLLYFFADKDGKEILLIADDASKYPKLVGEDADRIPYASNDSSGGHEAITGFRRMDVVRPNKVTLQHWDWTKAALQKSEAAANSDPAYADTVGLTLTGVREIYEHDARPITFDQYSDGSGYGTNDTVEQAKIRRQPYVQGTRQFMADSTCTGLAVGTVFSLDKHPDGALDQEYVITSISHSAQVGDASQASGAMAELEATYSNHFTCVPAALTVRAPRPADKPRVRGIATARVVGEGDSEIYTDPHGRVKVQFHWDRIGQLDAKGAVFLRVAQMMAGQGWGSFFLPRVGMEVIVQFLEGDPDRPLVTGCVYNGENPPPYSLPGDATKSGFKSRSSADGGEEDYNELTFEDKKGDEQIILHAQKDLNENVENNHSTTVGASQTNSVGGDRSVSVSGKQTISVSKEEIYSVTENRTTTVNGDDSLTVATGKTYTLTLGDSSITITNGKIVLSTTGASLTLDHGIVDLKSHDGGQVYLTADAFMKSSSGSNVKLDANALVVSSQGSSVTLNADAAVAASTGGGLVLDANAAMSGAEASVTGTTKAGVTGAASSVTVEGAGATVSGPKVTSSAIGINEIAGGLIKIG